VVSGLRFFHAFPGKPVVQSTLWLGGKIPAKTVTCSTNSVRFRMLCEFVSDCEGIGVRILLLSLALAPLFLGPSLVTCLPLHTLNVRAGFSSLRDRLRAINFPNFEPGPSFLQEGHSGAPFTGETLLPLDQKFAKRKSYKREISHASDHLVGVKRSRL